MSMKEEVTASAAPAEIADEMLLPGQYNVESANIYTNSTSIVKLNLRKKVGTKIS